MRAQWGVTLPGIHNLDAHLWDNVTFVTVVCPRKPSPHGRVTPHSEESVHHLSLPSDRRDQQQDDDDDAKGRGSDPIMALTVFSRLAQKRVGRQ
jgi:hypothetical protein